MFPALWTMVFNFLALKSKVSQPNIVVILADDLGWNDVGWNNPDIYTPHLDRLAHQGIILNSSYVTSLCSPSRASLLTGYYPFRLGLQHGVLKKLKPHGLRTNFTLLPEKLRDLGYSTHIVGKWHLGFCKWEYTPTYRGFDSFYGFYTGSQDYYTHKTSSSDLRSYMKGYDFRSNTSVLRQRHLRYSTSDYGRRAAQIISEHDREKPLFLYLPFQAVHSPLQVPYKFEKIYNDVRNAERRKFSGMVTAMDNAVGMVIKALKRKSMYKKTLILFLSDNGGSPYSGGNNWPLRGGKATLWEGGNRVPSFIWGQMLKKSGTVANGLIHVTDWFPTLLAAAGGHADQDIDGINQWPYLQKKTAPSRKREFVYGLNLHTGRAAIRVGNYKLIEGSPGMYSGWYVPNKDGRKVRKPKRFWNRIASRNLTMTQLFNVADDPIESNDLSSRYPHIVNLMKQRLHYYHQKSVPIFNPRKMKKGLPKFHNGVWTPGWC